MAAVDVRVERARSGVFERGRDRGHRDGSRPSETLGTDSRRATRVPYDPMRQPTAPAYYDRRAPEYDDWYLGQALRWPGREQFDDDLVDVCAALAALPPARTLTSRVARAS